MTFETQERTLKLHRTYVLGNGDRTRERTPCRNGVRDRNLPTKRKVYNLLTKQPVTQLFIDNFSEERKKKFLGPLSELNNILHFLVIWTVVFTFLSINK